MSETSKKGEFGEAIVIADLARKGYKIVIPLGEDWRFDIIGFKNNNLYRFQVKCTESNGEFIKVRASYNKGGNSKSKPIKYTKNDIDFLVAYDITTNKCYYIPAEELGKGKAAVFLRITKPKNGNQFESRLAKDYEDLPT